MNTAVKVAIVGNAIPAHLLSKVDLPNFNPDELFDELEHPPVESVTEEMLQQGLLVVCTGLPRLPEDKGTIAQFVAHKLGWYVLKEDAPAPEWLKPYVIDLEDGLDSAHVLYMPLAEAQIQIGGTQFRVVNAQSATAMWRGHQIALEDTCVSWFEGYKKGAVLVSVGRSDPVIAVDMMADFEDEYGILNEDLRDEAIDMMQRLLESLRGVPAAKSLQDCLRSTEYADLRNTRGTVVLTYNHPSKGVVTVDADVLKQAVILATQKPNAAVELQQLLKPLLAELATVLPTDSV